MQKRGYFFTIDVLIALIIMVVGFIMIWSSLASRTLITQPYFLAQDMIDFLQSTKNKDVSSLPYVAQLIADGNITDYELTVLEQMALFYYLNNTPGEYYGKKGKILENYTKAILENATPWQYSFSFSIGNYIIFNQTGISGRLQNESDSLISSKTIVSVVASKDELSPPYIAEVRVWQ